jgi:deoxyribonuclease (pyrimidine dimer)
MAMPRINLVPPSELADQHLFAEFREITRVPKVLAKSLKSYGLAGVQQRIPKDFVLGTGHVMFFYNKGAYLMQRFAELQRELHKRGVNYNIQTCLDPDYTFWNNPKLCQDYVPTPEALSIIRERIAEKIAMKPTWYKWSKA